VNVPVRIAVIIPFRNELANLKNWTTNLQIAQSSDFEFFFVDDHSYDDGAHVIKELKLFNVSVLQLPNNLNGKKAAIALGVEHSSSEFILTLDADVQLPPNYFKSISERINSEADLTILPVAMRCDSRALGIYQYTEWQLMQALTKVSFHSNFPMMCNGANLLFSRSFFLKVSKQHYSISSGDDLFMLIEAVKSKAQIDLNDLCVQTPMMDTWTAAISQRLRWAGKSKKYPSSKLNVAFGLFALWQLLTIGGLICSFFSIVVLFFFVGIVFMESLCIALVQRKFYSWRMLVFQPILLVLYPFISLGIFITSLWVRPKWKDREVSLS
jgi:poly-beta-1,6-N-acetyl-D-glucosamine synthase